MKDIQTLLKGLRESNVRLSLKEENIEVESQDGILSDNILAEIREHKNKIVEYLKRNQRHTGFSRIPPVDERDHYPLSSSQRRLWVLSKFKEGNISYNIPRIYWLEGYLDRTALSHSFHTLITRHESLRTIFKEDEEREIRQFILSPQQIGFAVTYQDLRQESEQEEKIKKLVGEEIIKPFDPGVGPLLRAGLYQVADDKWAFVYVMHHIVSDGWSMGILIRELLLLYSTYDTGVPAPLSPLRIQYKDYAVWQQEQLSGASLKGHQSYWLKQMEGDLPILELPGDYSRPAIKTYNGEAINKIINAQISDSLRVLSQEQGATLFMGLLAAVNVLLYRNTFQEDIILGSPIAGREHVDLEDQIGFYVNTLALRTRFSGDDSYSELLENVKQVTLGAYAHQVYPFDELVDELPLRRDMSRNALFDVMVALQNKNNNDVRETSPLSGLRISGYEKREIQTAKLDLTFTFVERGAEIQANIEYNSDIYKRETIDRLANQLERLLDAVVTHPSAPIRQLNYLSQKEKDQLLLEFNDTKTPYPSDKTMVGLFEAQVAERPDSVALVFEDKEFTYKELNEKANLLAHYLKKTYGIQPDDLLGIALDRNEWLIIAILGVLKSGGAYVPVDPAYPQDRIDYILADSGCKVLIDEPELARFINEQHRYSRRNPALVNQPDDLVYVIYTSGSTGRPKGCMLENRGVVNRLEWMWNQYGFSTEDIILQKTTFTFDVSVWEIFLPLCWGTKMVLCRKEDITSPERILSFISRQKVSCLHFVPGMLNAFISFLSGNDHLPGSLESLRKVITSGEALPVETVRNWYNLVDIPLHNLYGPTEASIDVSYYPTTARDSKIPIGRPIWNTRLYILDERRQLLPIGVAGEICIGGDGLARGYLNKPDLTAEKFVPDPFRKDERIYRTGDSGRWLPDGNIEFIGRKDDQVKIRGYRIELGEIESVLQAHSSIDAAVVLASSDNTGEKELTAYIVGKDLFNIPVLKAYLHKTLPAYMVPGHFVQLEALPLTPNGKTDRKRLAEMEVSLMQGSKAFAAPCTETEKELSLIWEKVLGKETIGRKDDFFELGGHSLKATRLASQIHKKFEVKIDFQELFAATILEEQALLIDQARRISFITIPAVATQPNYPLSSAQRRLWVLSQHEQSNVAYNASGIYVFEGVLNKEALSYSFDRLIERHEILRTVFRQDESGEVKQFVLSPEETGFRISYQDLRHLENAAEKAGDLALEEKIRPFDMATGPLLRAALFQMTADKWIFTCVMHHIISDAWSKAILIKELLLLYNAYLEGAENPLSPLRIQYKDYAAWQQQQLSGDVLHAHKTYWLNQMEGELPVLDIAGDKPRPALKTYNGGIINKKLGRQLCEGIRSFTHQQGGTLYMGLLAAVYTLLYKYTGQKDIIVGSPIAGRGHIDLEDQIGFYINALALRLRFNGDDSYEGLLKKVKQITLGAYEYQLYPFDQLIEDLNLQRDLSRTPLFDIAVGLQNAAIADTRGGNSLGSLKVSGYGAGEDMSSKFDLLFNFTEIGEELNAGIVYNSDIFDRGTIERLADHFERLLEGILADPSVPIGHLEYLSAEEKGRLLEEFGRSVVGYPEGRTVVDLFEEQAAAKPEAIALVFEDRELSYRELEEKSSRLAHYLRTTCGIGRDDLVGILLDRSEGMIIALLGILKAGGAYVAIEPDIPDTRKEYILTDTGIRALITQTDYMFDLSYYGGALIAIDIQLDTLDTAVDFLRAETRPEDLAYVLYTSGSTGQPKGVMISHGALVDYTYGILERTNMRECRSFGLVSTIAADLGNTVIYPSLCTGGKLQVFSAADVMSAERMADVKVDCVKIVPSHWKALQEGEGPFLPSRCLIFGGEPLTADVMEAIRVNKGQCRVYNHYGPSETTIGKLIRPIDLESVEIKISLGSPFCNTSIYIVDEQCGLLPIGVAGEICIGGEGLARGYLNNAGLTGERFVIDPFRKEGRMYKTGDLGRWLADGTVEFLGRKDDQVKIRGYRIELGEIGIVLTGYGGIESAVVLARPNKTGEKELVAYIVSRELVDIADMRRYVSGILPGYMVPGHYVQLEGLPLTANGKVDRKKLPDPEGLGREELVKYIPPRTETEEKLALIWQEVLGRERIGIKDDFFVLGGHSLRATRLASQIHKQFEVKIDFHDLFTWTVLEEQARLIDGAPTMAFSTIRVAPMEADYPLSSSQRRLWVLSRLEESNIAYNVPGVYVLEGDLNTAALTHSFCKLIERHEILRTAFRENSQGEPRQRILPAEETVFRIGYQDLRQETAQEEKVRNLVRDDLSRPFDLEKAPLIRVALYQTGEHKWVLTNVLHHIISDGWSKDILIRELLSFYHAHSKGVPDPLPSLRIQYKDFAVWQQEQLQEVSLQEHRAYWLQQFEGGIPQIDISGRKRPLLFSYKGNVLSFTIDEVITAGLLKLTGIHNGTFFMSLLFFVKLLLFKYTAKNRIIVGTSLGGRSHPDLENQIGLYLNNLPLITDIGDDMTLGDFYILIKRTVLGALHHQVYPLDFLIDEIDYRMDKSRPGLFNVLVELHTNTVSTPTDTPEGLLLKPYEREHHTSMFDLSFNFRQFNNQTAFSITYNTDLFDRAQIILMQRRFVQLLINVAGDYDENAKISAIDFRLDAEKEPGAMNSLKLDVQEIF